MRITLRNHQTIRGKYRKHATKYRCKQRLPRKVIKSQGQNKQMVLHPTKKPLYSKGNSQENEEATNRMGGNLCPLYSKVLTARIYKELQKHNNNKAKYQLRKGQRE